MNFLRKLLRLTHRRPNTDRPDQQPASQAPGRPLRSYAQTVEAIRQTFEGCSDIKLRELPAAMITDSPVFVVYFESLIKAEAVEDACKAVNSLVDQPRRLRPNETSGDMSVRQIHDLEQASQAVLDGWTLFVVQKNNAVYAVNTYMPPARGVERSETESVILGPQESFNESIQTNLGLLRKRLKTPQLKVVMLTVGNYTQSAVCICYVEGIAQQEYVESLAERVKHVAVDGLQDTGELAQLVDDNPFSPFPQYHMTERPDRIAAHLLDGKVALLMDGSPFALTGPASFIEFFQSSEDFANRWFSASVIRALRIVGVLISISLSALYVAVVTFHYQMIPSDMLVTLTESRARVPWPPIYETLLMELTIELLREAGARLPTKVGQTIGIVGGIVIGQAAVTAGLTSNILIISVALSTVASFITPSYVMSSALRAIRFPLILFAGMYGIYGLAIGLLMIVIHFLRLSSLGAPYLTPFAPLRLSDWKDTFLRAPTPLLKFRPTNNRPRETQRMMFEDETTPPAVPTSTTYDQDQEGEKST